MSITLAAMMLVFNTAGALGWLYPARLWERAFHTAGAIAAALIIRDAM